MLSAFDVLCLTSLVSTQSYPLPKHFSLNKSPKLKIPNDSTDDRILSFCIVPFFDLTCSGWRPTFYVLSGISGCINW